MPPQPRHGERPLPSIPVIVGPFPRKFAPGGVSLTNEKFAAILEARGIAFEQMDIGAPGYARGSLAHRLDRLRGTLAGVWRILSAPSTPWRSYEISLDGGGGLIYNMLIVATARLKRAPMLLYHHSTSYILSDSTLMRLLLLVAGKQPTHVVCSRRMFEMFRARYGVPYKFLHLSNAAWISPSPLPHAQPSAETIHLGYLGVLTEEKGVLRALETFEALLGRGIGVKISIAGTQMSDTVRAEIERMCAKHGEKVRFLGAVPESEKWSLFAALDYFLFPTLYRHETQSSVAPEAMSAGTPVIAYDHRFVGELIRPAGGHVIPIEDHFASAAADWIALAPSVADRLTRCESVQTHYKSVFAQAAGQIENLIDFLIAR